MIGFVLFFKELHVGSMMSFLPSVKSSYKFIRLLREFLITQSRLSKQKLWFIFDYYTIEVIIEMKIYH